MALTEAFITARKTQPRPRKVIEIETSSGLTPNTAKMYEAKLPKPFSNLIKKHFPPNHNLHPLQQEQEQGESMLPLLVEHG